ncbi:MAG: nucleotidyltransferase [Desulfobacteraceae bacterium]|nr:nucleotidyltransferase [Desulfobacteraceae bacterium]
MNKNEIIKTLRHFKDNNQKKYNIRKIGIFGSVAKGKMTDQSDIDIVVETDRQDLFNLIGIKQDLEEKLYLPVDVVSYRENMNKFLKQRIDKEAFYV